MLSKEEIEKTKDFMIFYKNYCLNKETANIEHYETVNNEEFVYKNIEEMLEYIKHLESREQKLIEKLEEDIDELETLNDNYTDADIFEGIYTTRGQIIKAKEILSILKGENQVTVK